MVVQYQPRKQLLNRAVFLVHRLLQFSGYQARVCPRICRAEANAVFITGALDESSDSGQSNDGVRI